jgi:uncharacterized protein (TIGR03086 family)
MTARPVSDGLLEQAVGYALRSVTAVTPELLTRPTPCAAWDLAMLLQHTCESLAAFTEGVRLGRVAMAPAPADASRTDAAGVLTARASGLLDAWTQFSGPWILIGDQPLAVADFAAAGALEIAVHGWDVARACEQPLPIPAPLADRLLGLAPLLISDADRAPQPGQWTSAAQHLGPSVTRPPLFGRPVTVPPWASASDRLAAFLGRTSTAWQPE